MAYICSYRKQLILQRRYTFYTFYKACMDWSAVQAVTFSTTDSTWYAGRFFTKVTLVRATD